MMFVVRWEEDALNDLAALWMAADPALRQTITTTTHQIDQQLRGNVYDQSESRLNGRRVIFLYPLGASFRVEQDEQTVSILHVWRFQRRVE